MQISKWTKHFRLSFSKPMDQGSEKFEAEFGIERKTNSLLELSDNGSKVRSKSGEPRKM